MKEPDAEEKLERIFDKFYRVDASRNTSTGGAGLGLAIAKEIVEMHGGRICAESDEKETRFIVTLPKDMTEKGRSRMKFIHIADVHLGAEPEAGREYSANRGSELWDSLERVVQVCQREQTDLLLIAGDCSTVSPFCGN